MSKVKLSLGFDVERPHGSFTESKKSIDVRKRQITFIKKLSKLLDEEEVPRTFFILGNYLEKCLDDFSTEELRKVYDHDNKLNEIQQHTYGHPMIRNIKERADKQAVTPKEFGKDLLKANSILKDILDVSPTGIRTPFGYSRDLLDIPELLAELERLKFRYVSSDLRSENSLEAPLTVKRQPHTYYLAGYPNIVEIPSHGWQDAIFTGEMAQKFLKRKPIHNAEQIFGHYNGLLERAIDLAKRNTVIYVSLCLHPWAMMEYDPTLRILRRTVNSAKSKNIEIISYGTVADEVLTSKMPS
ncbi:MAG: polysaccharide deacetylase family protein [Candidatus Odinarchaeota archaeon]